MPVTTLPQAPSWFGQAAGGFDFANLPSIVTAGLQRARQQATMPTIPRTLERTPEQEELFAAAQATPRLSPLQQLESILTQIPGQFEQTLRSIGTQFATRGGRGARAAQQAAITSGLSPLEATQAGQNIYRQMLQQFFETLPGMRLQYAQTMAPLWGQYAQLGANIPLIETQTEAMRREMPTTEEMRLREEQAQQEYWDLLFGRTTEDLQRQLLQQQLEQQEAQQRAQREAQRWTEIQTTLARMRGQPTVAPTPQPTPNMSQLFSVPQPAGTTQPYNIGGGYLGPTAPEYSPGYAYSPIPSYAYSPVMQMAGIGQSPYGTMPAGEIPEEETLSLIGGL